MPFDFPIRAAELSDAWLTGALCRSGAIGDSAVVGHSLRALAGTGQTSETVKIELTYDRPAPAAPASVVAKFASANDATRALFHGLGLYEAEVRFYSELAPDVGIRVPVAHHAVIDSGSGWFVILMEDMEACGGPLDASDPLSGIELAIDQLAVFHAKWWNDSRIRGLPWLRQIDDRSHYDRLGAMFQHSLSKVEQRYGNRFTGYIRDAARATVEHWDRFWPLRQGQQVTLLHGDCAPNQMVFPQGDKPGFAVFDWSTVSTGVAGLDVGKFLLSCFDVTGLQRHQARLTERYHRGLQRQGIDYSAEQLDFDIRSRMLVAMCILVTAVAHTDTSDIERRLSEQGIDWPASAFDGMSQQLEYNRVIETLQAR